MSKKEYWRRLSELVEAYNRRSFKDMIIEDVIFKPVNPAYNQYGLLDLRGIDFSGVKFKNVKFMFCNFRDANFSGAEFDRVVFIRCSFDNETHNYEISVRQLADYGIRNICKRDWLQDNTPVENLDSYYINPPLDTDGKDIIGYKLIGVDEDCMYTYRYPAIAKLRIPFYTERITYKDDKCRAACAEVLDIYTRDGVHYNYGRSLYTSSWKDYEVGHMVYADSFDDEPMEVCRSGIHFFLTEEEAWDFIC